MDMNEKKPIKWLGYILIAPALICVPMLFFDFYINLVYNNEFEDAVAGFFYGGEGGGGYSIYCGLSAIAGAYLLKDKN